MVRKQAAAKRQSKDRIHWRGHEVTRIEAFSDAVFGFAITLLIVSLEVPKNIEELFKSMHGFIPFAVCFTLIFQVWMVQNVFFRRYGMHDEYTLILNAMLLFVVLFFVYPLKFLFNNFNTSLSSDDGKYLYFIYSGGFAAIYLLFTLMYQNAWRRRADLELTDSEVFETRTNVIRNLLMASVGIASVIIASFGSKFLGLAGIIYVLIGPMIAVLHHRRAKKHDRMYMIVQSVPVAETKIVKE